MYVKLITMKNLSLLFLSVLLVFSACDKEDEPNHFQIPNEEAADLIATSLAEDGGLQTIFMDAVTVVNEVTSASTGGRQLSCGATDNTTFNYASQTGETPSYQYHYDYGWILNCAEQQPSSVDLNLTYDGAMESPDFTFTFEGTSGFTVTEIMEPVLVINGNHNRASAYHVMSDGQQYSGSHTFAYTLTEIKISKETSSIVSGAAAVQLSGTTNRGVYTVNATITYNGDGTATATINGQVYGIDISTGTINNG